MRRALAALALLAACDDPAPAPPPDPPTPAALEPARAAAEAALRARWRDGAPRLRGVQAFPQAVAGQVAVCGRAQGTPLAGDPLVPWVAVVALDDAAPRVLDLVLATTAAEATRVFWALSDRCFDGGGPPAARPMARPLPPAPSEPLPAPAPPPRPALATPDPPPSPATPGRVVTITSRSPANIRAAPGGGGEVVRQAPRLSRLEVLGDAPGGWLLVGEAGTPWGWLHRSLLEQAAPENAPFLP